MRERLQALIFDLDGTLADTERDGHRPAYNRAFADAGLDWHWDPALYGELLHVAGGRERIAHYVRHHHPARLAEPGIETLIGSLLRAKTEHFVAIARSGHLCLRPGVRPLIDRARASGLRLAIATTTLPENVSALLEHALAPGSEAWFECIGAGDIVPAKKPAPDIYQWVLARLGLPAGACLAFEDSENGLRAARGAGLATVVTPNGYTLGQDFAGAVQILTRLDDRIGLADLQRWHAEG